MGAAAFWISLALFLIAAMYFRSRSETTKHETLRQIVEKTGQVNEAQLKSLFEPATNGFHGAPAAGAGYRAMRIVGLLLILLSIGAVFLFAVIAWSGTQPWSRMVIGCASSSIVAMLGIGLFIGARFLAPPPGDPKDRQAIG